MLASELAGLAAGDQKSRRLAKVVVSLLANPIALRKLPEGDGAESRLFEEAALDFSCRSWDAALLISESFTESPDMVEEVNAEDDPETEESIDKLSKEASLGNLVTVLSISHSRSFSAFRLPGLVASSAQETPSSS